MAAAAIKAACCWLDAVGNNETIYFIGNITLNILYMLFEECQFDLMVNYMKRYDVNIDT